MCGSVMKYITTKEKQHRRDQFGVLVEVTREFYGCTNSVCKSIVNLDYRTDGHVGELARDIAAERVGNTHRRKHAHLFEK